MLPYHAGLAYLSPTPACGALPKTLFDHFCHEFREFHTPSVPRRVLRASLYPGHVIKPVLVDAQAAAGHLARIHARPDPTPDEIRRWAGKIRQWANRGHVTRHPIVDPTGRIRVLFDLRELEKHASTPVDHT